MREYRDASQRYDPRRGGARRSARSSPSAGGDRSLAARFAREPELIQAFVETSEEGAEALQPIWRAVQEAVDSYPAYAELYYFAAKAALRMGRVEEANRLLERALQQNPSYVDALILAARVRSSRGQAVAAIELLHRALQSGGDYPDVHTLLGRLQMQQNKRGLARVAFERALRLNPKLTEARKHLEELADAASREEGA